MARLTGEQLNQVMESYGVNELWSWSKIDKFIISPYEYYLKYIKKVKEDRIDCAYAPLGGLCHSIIESLYRGDIDYEEMFPKFDDGWGVNIYLSGLKFDRNNEEKNTTISDRYRANLNHFFKNHTRLNTQVALEQFMTAKVGDHVFQGYIDAVFRDSSGCFHIIDWKTSTKYSGKMVEEKSGQLVLYVISLLQRGIPLSHIKAGWNFLKYVNVTYPQKNGSMKSREIERSKIGEALQTSAKMWLKAKGYGDQLDDYLLALASSNDINVLPDDVRDLFTISDCYVYIPLTEALVNSWEERIISTIAEIKMREAMYAETKNDAAFWDTDESIKSQDYYFATLCGYSANLHLPYKAYLEKLNAGNDSLYSGVGSDSGDNIPVISAPASSVDLSWLNDL